MMCRRKLVGPTSLHDVEASHVDFEPMPGAVAVKLVRNLGPERRAGQPARRMFIELSVSEALEHHRKLGMAIAAAGALGSVTPGKDSAPLL